MVDFRKIKTKYVLNKLKETDDKELIETLMKIEDYIEKNPNQMFACMNFDNLKRNHNEDYLEILREMKPKEYVKRNLLTEFDKKIEEKEKELERLREERENKETELTWEIMQKMSE
ncbi:MAG: hypothetical protein PHU51_04185 [Candidatus Nanoarchaeia archaeon]|nr:hypothetical protein [Candidatus Nanoarchaeia archaeon]